MERLQKINQNFQIVSKVDLIINQVVWEHCQEPLERL